MGGSKQCNSIIDSDLPLKKKSRYNISKIGQ